MYGLRELASSRLTCSGLESRLFIILQRGLCWPLLSMLQRGLRWALWIMQQRGLESRLFYCGAVSVGRFRLYCSVILVERFWLCRRASWNWRLLSNDGRESAWGKDTCPFVRLRYRAVIPNRCSTLLRIGLKREETRTSKYTKASLLDACLWWSHRHHSRGSAIPEAPRRAAEGGAAQLSFIPVRLVEELTEPASDVRVQSSPLLSRYI
jgi:hypothetical protein